jgi:hypothetical protein
MAIRIVRNLDAVQESARLPFRVDLTQVLSTFQGSETVTIEYWLDPEHDVWFDNGSKDQVERAETISFVDTPIAHRVTLVHGAGQPVDNLAIHQKLTDGSGAVQQDFDVASIVVQRD